MPVSISGTRSTSSFLLSCLLFQYAVYILFLFFWFGCRFSHLVLALFRHTLYTVQYIKQKREQKCCTWCYFIFAYTSARRPMLYNPCQDSKMLCIWRWMLSVSHTIMRGGTKRQQTSWLGKNNVELITRTLLTPIKLLLWFYACNNLCFTAQNKIRALLHLQKDLLIFN